MTREDRAKEAAEYHRAVTLEGWEYESLQVEILQGENALVEIDVLMNKFAREGWRVHTFQISIDGRYVYIVFERRRDYDLRDEEREIVRSEIDEPHTRGLG